MNNNSDVALGEMSRITIGGAIMRVKTGRVSFEIPEHDTTTNEDEGFQSSARGPRRMVVEADMQYRRSDNPLTNPPNLEEGDYNGPACQVYPDFENDPSAVYVMDESFVGPPEISIEGTGIQGVKVTLKSQGRYFTPNRP